MYVHLTQLINISEYIFTSSEVALNLVFSLAGRPAGPVSLTFSYSASLVRMYILEEQRKID